MIKYVQGISARDLFDSIAEAQKDLEGAERSDQLKAMAVDRTRNILRLPEGERMSEAHQQLADQMERIIRGEPLSKKGRGGFRIPTEGRKPDQT